MALIRVDDLCVEGRLQPLSFTLAAGQMLGVIGPNGAGKSTLLRCLAGLQPHQGSLRYEQRSLGELSPRQRARLFGYLPQAQHSAWPLCVEDVVALGRLPWGDEEAVAISAAMRQAGVIEWRRRPVSHLSGGEQARVWLARVLAGQPRVLLADEPIASLDLLYQRQVLDLLREQARGPQATILSLHDLGLAARYCDRLCLLAAGRLLAFGTPAQVLTPELLRQAFQVDMHIDLHSVPPIVLPR